MESPQRQQGSELETLVGVRSEAGGRLGPEGQFPQDPQRAWRGAQLPY